MEPSDVLLCPAMPPTTDTPLPLVMFREPIRDRQVDNICSCYPERPPACSRRAGGLSPVIPTRAAGVSAMARRGPWGTLLVHRATKCESKDHKTAISRVWKRIQGLGEPEQPRADQPEKPKAERKAKRGARSPKGAPSKGKASTKTSRPKAHR